MKIATAQERAKEIVSSPTFMGFNHAIKHGIAEDIAAALIAYGQDVQEQCAQVADVAAKEADAILNGAKRVQAIGTAREIAADIRTLKDGAG